MFMQKKRPYSMSSLLLIATFLLILAPHPSQAHDLDNEGPIPSPEQTRINTLHTDANKLQFQLTTPVGVVTDKEQLTVAGLTTTIQEPGAPALPYYSTYIALPPETNATINVTSNNITTQHIPTLQPAASLNPAEMTEADSDLFSPYVKLVDGQLTTTAPQPIYEPDPTIYGRNAAYPATAYTLSEPMYYRDLRLVQLHLYPFQYNPVTGILQHSQDLTVEITFSGQRDDNLRPLSTKTGTAHLADMVLNYEQAAGWHSLPQELRQFPNTELPIGVDSYKIELQEDGIYEITYTDLMNAGMDVDNINPNTFALLYRGDPVAYQFIGNSDDTFTADEKIRFYGWAFNGPRTDAQYITDNVFWLLYDKTPTPITSIEHTAGFSPTHTFTESVTAGTDDYYFGTWTDNWDNYPNEPDAWYWDRILKRLETVLTNTYSIDLPYPVLDGGTNVNSIVEITSRQPANTPHTVDTGINDNISDSSRVWFGVANVNIEHSVPISILQASNNEVHVISRTPTSNANSEILYLNRITVDYQRYLNAIDNQLFFTDHIGGQREFHMGQFSENDVDSMLFWDITNPNTPVAVNLTASNIISGNTAVTYTVGSDHAPNADFLITSADNILTTANSSLQLSQYTAADIQPATDGADWVAISHNLFIDQAQRLADHRALYNMTTHVVDVEHIINQYGYGLPIPQAIQNYLTYALSNWTTAPSYVVLVGDATHNPRNLDCLAGCFTWDTDEPIYVITNLVFEDRFQGLIPSDHPFTTLIGDDILSDLAIGRIPAQTVQGATIAIDKIIQFDENQAVDATNNWNQSVMYVSDNPDSGGNFCQENNIAIAHLDDTLVHDQFCLSKIANVTIPEEETAVFRQTLSDYIDNNSISLLNYRGHGSIDNWANENIVSTEETITDLIWQNNDEPLVVISADCLDNYFAWPGIRSLSEHVIELEGAGSAAHWSSTGLGFSFEHTVLQTAFYDALFMHDLTNIGDAINYAKMIYAPDYDDSEMYAFTLQGDPAMELFATEEEKEFVTYIPLIQK